jgi:SAM-dependent MidA family methyltransferase
VTSPELTQVFGELVGVWLLAEWHRAGSPPAVRLLELGPGSGLLMADVLRAMRTLGGPVRLEVALVEAGVGLSARQEATLRGVPVDTVDASPLRETAVDGAYREALTAEGTPLLWYRHLDAVPTSDGPEDEPMLTLAVAHEFFDALPAHQLVHTAEHGWRERLVHVTPDRDEAAEGNDAGEESPAEEGKSLVHTASSDAALEPKAEALTDASPGRAAEEPHAPLCFVLSPEETMATEQLARMPQLLPDQEPQIHDVLEVSFDTLRTARQLAALLCTGAGGKYRKRGALAI